MWLIGHGAQGSVNENGSSQGFQTEYIVETASGAIYIVYMSNTMASFIKSTDRGLTWSSAVSISSVGNNINLTIWYDRWSGIAEGKIHCAWCDSTNDDITYRSIDTENSDALSAEAQVFNGTSTATGSNISITRARGGNLYIHGVIDAGAEGGFFRSTDAGGTWGARTVNEAIATLDQIILLPGWAADNQDIMAFFWDVSANEISRYLYDDSGDSWAETSISASMTDSTTGLAHFAAAVDIANSQNLLAAWSAVDAVNADLRFWTITESAITEKTMVVENSGDDQGLAAVAINTTKGEWWVFYAGKSDGSETWTSSQHIYYKISTDGGVTWGAETRLSNDLSTIRSLWTTPRFAVTPSVVSLYIPSSGLYNRQTYTLTAMPRAQAMLGV